MKIAFLCNEYPPTPHGGIGSFVQTLGRGLVRAGHAVTVVGLGPQPGVRDDEGVRIVTLAETRVRGLSWWWDRRRVYRWLARAVRAREIEIVDVGDYWGLLPWAFPSAPVVVRLYLSEIGIARLAGKRPRWSVAWCERWTLARHRRWIAISEFALRDSERDFGPAPAGTPIIYCPIREWPESPAEVPALPAKFALFVGRVSERKGAYPLALAARRFLVAYPDVHLVYVGRLEVVDGVSAAERIRAIVGSDLAPRVHCLGRLESSGAVWACLRRAAVFVFPSAQEFFGLVMAEAMLAGCPVVAGDTSAVREFIVDGRTGRLVPADDPAAIATAVEAVLGDPAATARMTAAARAEVSARFDLEAIVRQNVDFYAGVIAAAGTTVARRV